jgi:formiminotetrahydrofolate cyclodeaminase
MLAEQPLTAVLDAFASSDPTPGGGSAAALTGALGASLLAMVAALPKTKTGAPEERQALDAARDALLRARDELVGLIDRDAAAYDLVVAAYRKPKTTDGEKAARAAAIQDALRVATEVPVETVRACATAIDQARAVAQSGNPSARSDVAVGIQTLMVAVQSAMFNVEANIGSLKDTTIVEQITENLRALQRAMQGAGEAIFKDANLIELYTNMARRLGSTHGAPTDKAAAADRLAQGLASGLLHLGSPEARQALEALASSQNAAVARSASAALQRFAT